MQRYLGIDFGSKRIGLAVGDDQTGMATPLRTVTTTARNEQVSAVLAAAAEFEVDALVIGLPLNMDDSEGPQAKAVRVFGDALAKRGKVEVHYVDERLTSVGAAELLAPAGLTRGKKKARLDRVAAQLILETFLDQQRGSGTINFMKPCSARPIGVIFDMDGVLVDSAAAHLRSWKVLTAECGREVSEGAFAHTFGRANHDVVPMLFGPVPPAQLAELAERKESIYRDLIRAHPPIVDGAAELIRELHAAGARLAIGSSGPRANVELIRDALGARELIPFIVSGDDVMRGKPDPEVFTQSCARLGLPPAQCVVIEDAPVGVLAAKSAGTAVVAVLIHHPASAFPLADLLVRQLADLTAHAVLSLAAPSPHESDCAGF